MTAHRFRVQTPLTQHLGLPQRMKLHPVHHLSRLFYQVTEGVSHTHYESLNSTFPPLWA